MKLLNSYEFYKLHIVYILSADWQVEIYKPKSKLDIDQLRCKLKDIYFPYIQVSNTYGARTLLTFADILTISTGDLVYLLLFPKFYYNILNSIVIHYFIHLQCDEESKAGKIWKTVTPVNFEVWSFFFCFFVYLVFRFCVYGSCVSW